jgi:hypothetical protein
MSASRLATRVIKSIFFKKALEQAVVYAKSNTKISDLLNKVSSKTQNLHKVKIMPLLWKILALCAG